MTAGHLLWRCRICGDVTHGEHVADVATELRALIDAPKKSARISVHRCAFGAFGVTDLAGAEPDTEPDTARKGAG